MIAAVTLRCVPAFRLRNIDRPEPLEDGPRRLQERADAHDHFEFWTFPHADVALTRTHDRTDDPPDDPGRARAYSSDVLMDNHAFRAVNEVARRFPRTIPRLNRFASAVASQRERVDWSYAIFASERLVRFEEMEYSVPREQAVAAVRAPARCSSATRSASRSSCASRAGDDALLSPAHGRDSAFVAVHVFQGMAYEPAFREVEAALWALGGRPHWGKRSFLSAQLAPRYPALGRLPAHPCAI